MRKNKPPLNSEASTSQTQAEPGQRDCQSSPSAQALRETHGTQGMCKMQFSRTKQAFSRLQSHLLPGCMALPLASTSPHPNLTLSPWGSQSCSSPQHTPSLPLSAPLPVHLPFPPPSFSPALWDTGLLHVRQALGLSSASSSPEARSACTSLNSTCK